MRSVGRHIDLIDPVDQLAEFEQGHPIMVRVEARRVHRGACQLAPSGRFTPCEPS